MKKIITCLAATFFMAGASYAQLTVTNGDQTVNEGDILTFTASALRPGAEPSILSQEPYIETSRQGTLRAVLTITSDDGDYEHIEWCGITEQCATMTQKEEIRTMTITPGTRVPVAVHASFPNGYDTYEAQVTLYLDDEYITSFTELLTYEAEPPAISVTNNGVEVNDGDVLTFYASGRPGNINIMTNEPYITNNDEDGELRVILSMPSSSKDWQHFTWCGITNLCAEMTSYRETRTVSLAAGQSVPIALHADFTEGIYETYTANFEVLFHRGEVTDEERLQGVKYETVLSFTQKMVYSDSSTGFENATADEESLEYAQGQLTWSFPTSAARTLKVFSLDGRLVKSVQAGTTGSLSLNGLSAGTYLCTVQADGKTTATRKVIVF